MKQEPISRRAATADAREGIPRLQAGEDVNMTTPAPPRRPITPVPLHRAPLPNIPPAVFREARYADGKPYEETAGGRIEGEQDERA
jgi:hypothetical protein